MRRRLGSVVAACALALGGCAEELRFRVDDRLRLLAPPDRALVAGPVVVRWAIASHRGLFGVFVDRPPMRPGEDVDALAEDDPGCRPRTGCPDRAWLERHGVHLTARRLVRLPALRVDGGRDLGAIRRHEVSVVLLDGRGRRIGESAWTLALLTRDEGG